MLLMWHLGGKEVVVRHRMWQSMRCSVLVHVATQGSELGWECLGLITIEYQAWQAWHSTGGGGAVSTVWGYGASDSAGHLMLW